MLDDRSSSVVPSNPMNILTNKGIPRSSASSASLPSLLFKPSPTHKDEGFQGRPIERHQIRTDTTTNTNTHPYSSINMGPRGSTSERSLRTLASMRKRASDTSTSLNDVVAENQRLQMLESIDKLACHLPLIVQNQLVKQVVQQENEHLAIALLGKSLASAKKQQSTPRTSISTTATPTRRCLMVASKNAGVNTESEPVLKTKKHSIIGMTLDDSHGSTIGSETSSIAEDQSWAHLLDDSSSSDEDDSSISSSEASEDDSINSTSSSREHDQDLLEASNSVLRPKRRSTASLPELLMRDGDDDDDDDDHPNDQGVAKMRHGRLSSSGSCRNLLDMSEKPSSPEDAARLQASLLAQNQASRRRLESTRHTSALLFVDISGFVTMSRSLDVESLSKVINSYFQKIVDIIRAYKGDILKFAGDALIVEWRTTSTSNGDPEAPLLATVCAAKLVDACSDFAVRIPNPIITDSREGPTNTALLNIHCAIGYGKVVATHVGNQKRMEYVICGDALRQISQAMKIANKGEVVASPEAMAALQGTLLFSNSKCKSEPQIIATKSQLHFRPVVGSVYDKIMLHNANSRLSQQCQSWNLRMLRCLYQRMSPYVHPAVLADSSGPPAANYSSLTSLNSSANNQRRRTSQASIATSNSNTAATEDARLRDVLTIFIQPILPDEHDLLGSKPVPEAALELLQQIMLIVQSEAEHFQGQLRQFIVDDKGLVVILNFGLQGSTFPNMVEERAIPCISNVKTLLKTELNLGCKMGATYGKAYCGVVGGLTRHEYAVLGPSVNLAARLMCSNENPGILVDQALKMKAGPNHPFKSLPPVVAKGYDKPVRIYEPASSFLKAWVDIKADELVGRSAETFRLLCMAKDILKASKKASSTKASSKMVFICGPYGLGKSSMMSQATRQIEHLCNKRGASHHFTRHVFNDDDSFKPFSVVRPLFLDILRKKIKGRGSFVDPNCGANLDEEIRKQEEAQLHLLFLQNCLQAGVPMQYIEMFAGLIFTDKLSDGIGKWSDKAQKMTEWNRVARLLVHVYLQMTDSYDLVVLAMDDLSGMDEFSWKIVRGLYDKTKKFFIMGAARSEFGLNIQRCDWDDLKGDSSPGTSRDTGSRFSYMRLGPLSQDEIGSLARKRLSKPTVERALSKTVYALSQGNPYLACQILDQMYACKKLDDPGNNVETEGVKEVLINRYDALPADVRLPLNCGAMLGLSFSLADAMAVLEKYNGITTIEDQLEHAEMVRQSFSEAETSGFLSSSQILGRPGAGFVMYSFSHPLLREVISQQTLQEWKDKIQRLIDSVRSPEYVTHHDSWRNTDISVKQKKPIRSV